LGFVRGKLFPIMHSCKNRWPYLVQPISAQELYHQDVFFHWSPSCFVSHLRWKLDFAKLHTD
jgi:hypothetical protein